MPEVQSTPVSTRRIAIAGATGFLGRALCRRLIGAGPPPVALVRREPKGRIEPGSVPRTVDPFDAASLAAALEPGATLVALVGASHPAPWKAEAFDRIDRAAGLAAVEAVRRTPGARLVYVSVAQPAPVMKRYLAARSAVEAAIRAAAIPATILRPWYVLGPGRRWPVLLSPFYWVLSLVPSARAAVRRLGLLTQSEMVDALARAALDDSAGVRVWDVTEIRRVAAERARR